MCKKLKIGVIGLGRIGQIHLANLCRHMPETEVVIASDLSVSTHDIARNMGVQNLSTDASEVIDHPDVEAVIICSPTSSHVPYTIAAAKQNKHIFCEKPLDISLSGIQQTQKVVEAHGVKLMLGFNRRFDANFNQVRESVLSGRVGQPHILRITSRDPSPPPISYLKKSGGIFLDMSIHDFDMARFIVGSEVMEVYVKGDALIQPEIKEFGDIDTAIIVLTFENGAMAVIDNSRKAVYGYDQRLEIFGSKGMAKAENNTPHNTQFYAETGIHGAPPLHFFLERYQQAYRTCLETFVACITKDYPSPIDCQDGLMATAIGIAAMKSLSENRPVKMQEVLESIPSI
ncbi:myo-inositol 2-dehydrogenase/D-chiro-inositol 1-dehydrogenase [Dyadobacter jejuensis]|uniref:Myo-inositol 2-dehydrogenase/D-chiro-inositol 1-dehydrogenase n=1 Tax=Dyadobacter jejuensis TaxID=1082580 RepID=A0A316B6Z5_9BACT|nr:inositol 2-dehydrogenase [Dyadobacter jejuensis]PWJ58347.1 myo-inositol 2-dehydrogenase/D-chiro-inositol 1-dehydrogenase [Dyadobacter jejuensis]